MRATATLLATAAMALAAIGLAVASPGGGELASARLQAASGAVHVSNSHAGQAVLTAAGMRPGSSASGTVEIGNDGDARGRFVLAATGLQDTTPGTHGTLLSEHVVLAVLDVTDPQAPDPVFEGEPGDLDEEELGTLEPGDERDYLVRITFATGDNRLQGAALSLGLAWRAATASVATPTPTATATPTTGPTGPAATPTPAAPVAPVATPTPAPEPVTPISLPDALGLPAATSCVKSGKLTLRLKGPNGTKVVSGTVAVNGRVKAKLKGAKARKPVSLRGLGKKSVKLKISVKASDGRTYTASRTYRACKR